ncbi:hypothetical protein PanWU01x14_050180 [Parasponia andersonii]|uniref:Uncharacterized protein n=1 Tax=Parasponia andersonii TaxID=3476 RepID=A0A2P5DMU2_PARAD|nr:hypothetical protein PanWU01x14_050180 [Parasponia andersonii]
MARPGRRGINRLRISPSIRRLTSTTCALFKSPSGQEEAHKGTSMWQTRIGPMCNRSSCIRARETRARSSPQPNYAIPKTQREEPNPEIPNSQKKRFL